MEIRNLTLENIDELVELWSQSFVFPLDQVSSWISEKSIKNCIGVFERNKLISALNIIPFEFYIRGKVLPLSGIGGVATFPEYRGKSYIHNLLTEALRISKERGLIFSMLYPFSFDFYRTFGWELGGFQKKYVRKTYTLPKFEEIKNVRKIPLEDWKIIKEIYEKHAVNFTGPLKRTEERWENLIFRSRNLTYLYLWEDGEPQGYLLYTVELTPIRRIIVREMICLNISSYKGFLSLFSRQSMSIEEVQWNTPVEDQISFVLTNPRGECIIEPTFMIRVIDLEKVFENLSFPEYLEEIFRIEVKDSYGTWNEGVWEIEIKNGKGKIEKGVEWDISLSINTLSQIISGTLSPKTAFQLGLLEVKNSKVIEKFDEIFPPFKTFSWDYF
ncbi:MAG: GNAT family N-acetyltransferase [Dictyoglomaceae bacterium]|nr:GNAT family N-acetyltransferase [Dictyoglomaceae bacterium]